MARHEFRTFRAKPHHRLSDLRRSAEASHWMHFEYARVKRRSHREEAGSISHISFNDAGRDSVDPDSLICVFNSGGLCQANDAVFTRDISRANAPPTSPATEAMFTIAPLEANM